MPRAKDVDESCRLARAILIPPRQNILCQAKMFALPDGGAAGAFGTTQGNRNMLSLRDNLNAIDAVQKVITFTFDGQSRPSLNPPLTGKPATCRQSRAERQRKQAKGVETCAQRYRVTASVRHGAELGVEPSLLNGGHVAELSSQLMQAA